MIPHAYIETSRHKNVFYTAGETYSIYKKMDELEAELAGMGFVRIHQSFLINMRYIGKLSSYVMVLTTGKDRSSLLSSQITIFILFSSILDFFIINYIGLWNI